MVRIAYMGIPFSNSEEAAAVFAARMGWTDAEYVPAVTSRGVVDALDAGGCDYGVMASGNIAAGPVEETVRALAGRGDLRVIDEIGLPIHHCVFVRHDSDGGVEVLVSHIQGLLQTQGNLRRLYPDAEWMEAEDTAYAAEMLAAGELPAHAAVVCRRNAGEAYGLKLIHADIEDRDDNITTFSLIGRA